MVNDGGHGEREVCQLPAAALPWCGGTLPGEVDEKEGWGGRQEPPLLPILVERFWQA